MNCFKWSKKIARSEKGVGMMEALIVTVIVAMSAVAFLTLSENQNLFLKRTRQVNARDQLSNFFQGVIKDRALFLYSAQHSKNIFLKQCLGDSERQLAPNCKIGQPQPLWIMDITDPELKRVWTASPEAPALFDEHGQGCEKEKGNYCRFQVSTTFTAYCRDDSDKCDLPARIVVKLRLKQISSNDPKITPQNLRELEFSSAHLLTFNKAPVVLSAPSFVTLSIVKPSVDFTISYKSEVPDFKVIWSTCESSSANVMLQCLPSKINKDQLEVTARLASHDITDKNIVGKFRIANTGPLPNFSKFFEVPIKILPVCYLPWGGMLESGFSMNAFEKSVVGFHEECKVSLLSCVDGVLSGSAKFSECRRSSPAQCVTPWGEQVLHEQGLVAFQMEAVPFEAVCPQENRVCTDGVLSGSFKFKHCRNLPPLKCNLPWGGQLEHGHLITAYRSSSVPYGENCEAYAQVRRCNNGILDGSYNYSNCTVAPPRSCRTPWGSDVQHNQKAIAYLRDRVPYGQPCTGGGNFEERICNNGLLSGSFGFASCFTLAP